MALAYCAGPGIRDDPHDDAGDNGFRIRGAQPTRVDAFVDAAFAFAVTLLVIAIGHVPASIGELVQAMRGVPAFAASFFVIARFWQSHRGWSRHYGIEDAYGTRLSLALVFIVLVYVYPLRMVAELTLASMSGGILAETPINITSVTELAHFMSCSASAMRRPPRSSCCCTGTRLRSPTRSAFRASERIRTRTLCARWLAVIVDRARFGAARARAADGPGREHAARLRAGLIYLLVYVGISRACSTASAAARRELQPRRAAR